MNTITTIEDLDVTSLSKKQLLNFFSLTISQEKPLLEADNIVSKYWNQMNNDAESPKDCTSLILNGKTQKELLEINKNFIANDTEKLNDVNKLLQEHQKCIAIQEQEYKEQRKKLTVKSFASMLQFRSEKDLENFFIQDAYVVSGVPLFLSRVLGLLISIFLWFYLYNYTPFIFLSNLERKHEPLFMLLLLIISLICYFFFRLFSEEIIKNLRLSKLTKTKAFIDQSIPLDLSKHKYYIKKRKAK